MRVLGAFLRILSFEVGMDISGNLVTGLGQCAKSPRRAGAWWTCNMAWSVSGRTRRAGDVGR